MKLDADLLKVMGKNTVVEAFDIEFVWANDEQIELRMPITDATRQPMGLLHGGISMMLAETAASIHATQGVDLSKKVPVGVEINGSHLNSAADGYVRAVGTVLRRSRGLIVHEVDIFHAESDKHLCRARVTNYYKKIG